MRKDIRPDPKDRITVDVDNRHFRFERWDDEVDFEIEPIGQHRTEHYEIEPNEEIKEGGYEFSTILDEKPATNKIEYLFRSKGVELYYQPELTQKEKDEGAHRPENVIGSYAVYASEPKVNRVGGKKYRTSKVGHIYRPKIIDANGSWVWGELEIKGGKLTVTIPQDFLDSAAYPVVVDPTFGYDTVGASSSSVNEDTIVGTLATLSEEGTVSKITTHISATTLDGDIRGAIYNADGTYTGNETEERFISAGPDWFDFDLNSPPLLASDDYRLHFWGNGNHQISADSGASSVHTFDSSLGATYPSWPTVDGTSSDFIKSIYATYTASGGGEEPVNNGLAFGGGGI